MIFSLIPIYPTIILFQFIYFLKEYKNISFKYKKITRAIIFFLLLLLIVPSISYKIIGNRSINIQYENDKIIIEKYLKEVFGEKYYKNMEILKPKDNLSSSYKVNTPLLNENFTITLDDEKKVILNSFYEEFVKENKLNDRLSSYLKMYYDFPSYYEINSSIYNFQINKINDIDDLIKDCEFKINYFNINKDSYNKDEIVDVVKHYYINYDNILKKYYNFPYLMFYVKINEKNYASIQTTRSENDKEKISLIFDGYNNESGNTILYEKVTINIMEN